MAAFTNYELMALTGELDLYRRAQRECTDKLTRNACGCANACDMLADLAERLIARLLEPST